MSHYMDFELAIAILNLSVGLLDFVVCRWINRQ
jgi:hypothetical protein